MAVAYTIERSTKEDEEKYEGHFFKLLTEEGPIDMKEEISLPSAAISMQWQGTNYEHTPEQNIFSRLASIEKYNIYEELDSILETELSFLTITLEDNKIMSFLYGAIPFLEYSLPKSEKLLTAEFSADFDHIYAIVKRDNGFGCVKIGFNSENSRILESLEIFGEFSNLILSIQSIICYLEKTLSEMSKKWSDNSYGQWHEFQKQLLLLYLWGIQSPELMEFLAPINEVKQFNDVTQKCINICNQIQRLSIIQFSQATDLLFHTVTRLNVAQGFRDVRPM